MSCIRHFLLLMWKNLILRKRHYILTGFETLLPTLLIALLAYMKANSGNGPGGSGGWFKSSIYNDTYHRIIPEMEIVDQVKYSMHQLVFAPNNPFTLELIRRSIKKVPLSIILQGVQGIEPIAVGTDQDIVDLSNKKHIEKNYKYMVGIYFDSKFPENGSAPARLSYKIRMQNVWTTKQRYSYNYNAAYDTRTGRSHAKKYIDRGFVGIQLAIDKTFMEMVCKECTKDTIPQVNAGLFPYPHFEEISEAAESFFEYFVAFFLVLSFIFICPTIIKGIVQEKETGVKELMKMMGLPEWLNFVGWMVNAMLPLTISIVAITILMVTDMSGTNAGGLVSYTDATVLWMFLTLYAIASVAFCFAVSSFFKRPTLAVTVGVILWLVSYFGPSIPLLMNYQQVTLIEKMLACLLPNTALTLGLKLIAGHESRRVMLCWSNLCQTLSNIDDLNMLGIFGMLIVATVIYLLISSYVSTIMPGDFGVAKPWYFPFTSPCIRRQKMEKSRVSSSDIQSIPKVIINPNFESDPKHLKVGIAIQGLRKVFKSLTGGDKLAIDGVTLNLYQGQITALLGHNGAGKTTTMSILTGMYSPTSGTAFIDDLDIRKNLAKIQKNLGICPQSNMIFNKLNVEEHLVLFGMLKGLTRSEAREEAHTLMDKMRLKEKAKTMSESLSGGQKRKLSLGIALIGGSKVIMLDEPTSGMDPEARRSMWDMLLQLRGKHTILLTTHFMEEADVLGDRIAIMAHGKVHCCGSSLFLKKLYGTGYNLTMTRLPNCSISDVTDVVKNNVENAILKGVLASELAYLLPANDTAKFPELFEALATQKEELLIESFGVSLTTMNEVFLKVGESADKELKTNVPDEESILSIEQVEEIHDENNKIKIPVLNRNTGFKYFWQKMRGLLRKRFLCTIRKRYLFISEALIPVLLTVLCLCVNRSIVSPFEPNGPLVLKLSDYSSDTVTLYRSDDDLQLLSSIYDEHITYGYKRRSQSKEILDSNLMDAGKNNLVKYQQFYIIAADFFKINSKITVNAKFSAFATHSAPLSVNLVNNAILQNISHSNYSIQVTNHPLPPNPLEVVRNSISLERFSEMSIIFAVLMSIGLALLAATFLVAPVQERACKAKQLQLMTGLHPVQYWMSFLLWDLLSYLIITCIIIILFASLDYYKTYINFNGLCVVFCLLFSFGWSAIPFSYVFSLVTNTPAGGFTLLTLIHIISGMVMTMIVYVFEMSNLPQLKTASYILQWIFSFFPSFPACYGFLQFSNMAATNNRCNYIPLDALNALCSIKDLKNNLQDYELVLISTCCPDMCIEDPDCIPPLKYLTWIPDSRYPIYISSFGIGQAVFFLWLDGFIFIIVTLLVEYGLFQFLWRKLFPKTEILATKELDEDVQREKMNVTEMVNNDSSKADFLIVDNLSKNFGNFVAVSGVSFSIEHGECFGLLGVNGAGKTTTFGMLTGDVTPTGGTAHFLNYQLTNNRRKFLSNIGYSPQFDGIVDVLTGKEMLQLFGALRGIPQPHLNTEITKLIRILGLSEHSDRPCGNYSGGNKRKLSTAMALVGDSPVIFLDEPTSGVDPVARRNLWDVLVKVQAAGRSIVLTSHSMDECEALCNRVAIMVNGQFQCLGGVQHLKSKFAQGFTVMIKLNETTETEGDEVQTNENETPLLTLKKSVEDQLQPCTLVDEHQGLLHYQITNTDMTLANLFQTMEFIKQEMSNIVEDYSISETTLEEVFLSFAKNQMEENRRGNVISTAFKACCCACCGDKKVVTT